MRITLSISALLLTGFLHAQPPIKHTPIPMTRANDGAEMYRAYCASCHGMDGKGFGPATAALHGPLPDLTKLAQANEGAFPSASVLMTLGRVRGSGAHGSEEMPIWGDVFRASSGGTDELEVQMRLYNLMRYLDGIQDPPSVKVTKAKTPLKPRITDIHAASGAAMFSAYCSSCHGTQGLGDGPAAVGLKKHPTDLTQLSANHRGAFPTEKITEILDRSPGTAAHGSKDMPIWGDAFRATGESAALAQLRIHNIVTYLRSLQR
ncbi:MAG: c-type cytochrome [Acidobacteria bacterium]|nr:c-type cytochrome [Acidobacteriota bacterium]